MAYDQEMSGIFSLNDKGSNPKRPDYTGDIQILGVKYRLAGWIREGKKGEFISLKASPPKDESQAPEQRQAPAPQQTPPPVQNPSDQGHGSPW